MMKAQLMRLLSSYSTLHQHAALQHASLPSPATPAADKQNVLARMMAIARAAKGAGKRTGTIRRSDADIRFEVQLQAGGLVQEDGTEEAC